MKRQQILNRFKKKYAKIDKALKRVITNFALEDIHLFRLEVKKLRSFLRLTSASKRKAIHLKLPEKAHRFYNILGTIRSLQLQQQGINELPREDYSVLLESYSNFITDRINNHIALAKKLVTGKNPFAKGRRKLLKRLPSKIRPATVRKFTSNKLEALTHLMYPSSLSDESLHSVRKLLKDILYTVTYPKKLTASGHPDSLMSREKINSVVKILGEFQDKCVGLDLLHTHYKQQQSEPQERVMWRRLENRWWNEKEINRAAIHKLFNKGFLLSLNHQQSGERSFPLPLKLLTVGGKDSIASKEVSVNSD